MKMLTGSLHEENPRKKLMTDSKRNYKKASRGVAKVSCALKRVCLLMAMTLIAPGAFAQALHRHFYQPECATEVGPIGADGINLTGRIRLHGNVPDGTYSTIVLAGIGGDGATLQFTWQVTSGVALPSSQTGFFLDVQNRATPRYTLVWYNLVQALPPGFAGDADQFQAPTGFSVGAPLDVCDDQQGVYYDATFYWDVYADPVTPDKNQTKLCDENTKCSKGPMATYSFHLLLASLHIEDTPISYAPPRGPKVEFSVIYNQREADHPPNSYFGNLGAKWTHNWLSYVYVTDDPASSGVNADVRVRGGGTETYTAFNSGTNSYAPDAQSMAILVRTSSTSYEKRFPDGSKEIFALSDSLSSYPRRIFLTKVVDPTGKNAVTLTYDSSFRIAEIKDALEQPTTLAYELQGDPLKITKVTDPFGRVARFDYTSGQLTKITDPVGIESQFEYDQGTDFIHKLTTPYGYTNFVKGESGNDTRWLEATDMAGTQVMGKQRVEYNRSNSAIPPAESPVPTGVYNNGLNGYNAFYWNKKAMADAPGDYTKAQIFHWLPTADGKVSGILHSEKRAKESRVYYIYPGQTDPGKTGTNALPLTTARLLDDGTPQATQFEYNSLGNLTKETDPVGRVFSYIYASNGIDLLEKRQTRGSNNELLQSFTYNSGIPHLPDKMTDAAGEPTFYLYNSYGQLLQVTNALNEPTTYLYDRDQDNDALTDGYLLSVTGPITGATVTYHYDEDKRVDEITQPDGYFVSFGYDAIDRPTSITYPDTTSEQFKYTRFVNSVDTNIMTLDPGASKDRLGRWTYREYNAYRQLTKVTDPLGHDTLFSWCNCGALESITDANGHITSFIRDIQGRLMSKTFQDMTSVSYTYESTTSRLKSVADSMNQTTNYSYYPDNNLYQVTYTNPQNPTPNVAYEYDPDYNRITSMMDGTGTTAFSYYPIMPTPTQNDGKLKQIDGPLLNQTDLITYTYDELGRVHSQDINGSTQVTNYDSLDRLTTTTNALASISNPITRVYDGATSRLDTLTYPDGQTATYDYFPNNFDRRLQTLRNQIGITNLSRHEYTYDGVRQIQTWTKTLGLNANALAFDYDDGQRLASVYEGNQQADYSYDETGNKVEDWTHDQHLQGPGGVKTIYSANNLNQLDSVSTQIGNSVPSDPVAITYDANGNMTYDGANEAFEWDAADRLVAINYIDSGDRTEFAYDGLGRRVKITEYGPAVTAEVQPKSGGFVGFDTAEFNLASGGYELKFEGLNPNGGNNTAFVDSVILNETLVPGGGFESPQLDVDTTAPGGSGWNYSGTAGIAAADGDMLQGGPSAPAGLQAAFIANRGSLWQYGSVTPSTHTLSFQAAQYSANESVQRLRVTLRGATGSKTFVWSGSRIAEERDGSGSIVSKRFFAEGEQRIGGKDEGLYYYSRDHLGSIREVTDSSGNLVAQYDYDAWGKSVVVSGNMNVDFGYTGHYFHQASGLNLAMYRAYSPSLGRWLSRDPIAETGGLNLYGYVGNNPMNAVDPFGLDQIINNSGSVIIVRGNPGAGHGTGPQQYGVVPPDGNIHGGPNNPIPSYPSPELAKFPYVPVGPMLLCIPPSDTIQDVDGYLCPKRGDQRVRGDELGPVTTLGTDSDGNVIVTNRDGRLGADIRFLLRFWPFQ